MSAGLIAMLAATLFGMPRPSKHGRRSPGTKVRDPQHPSARTLGDVWWLQPCRPGCPTSRAVGGRRMPTERTVPLPLQGCSESACTCSYRPLINQRRLERRSGTVRRQTFRLDHGADRRQIDRRRASSPWDGCTLR